MKKLTTQQRMEQGKPIETWQSPDGTWTWNVYRKYKRSQAAENKDPYSRWFCGVKSPYTHGSEEYGDVYVRSIRTAANCIYREEEIS